MNSRTSLNALPMTGLDARFVFNDFRSGIFLRLCIVAFHSKFNGFYSCLTFSDISAAQFPMLRITMFNFPLFCLFSS